MCVLTGGSPDRPNPAGTFWLVNTDRIRVWPVARTWSMYQCHDSNSPDVQQKGPFQLWEEAPVTQSFSPHASRVHVKTHTLSILSHVSSWHWHDVGSELALKYVLTKPNPTACSTYSQYTWTVSIDMASGHEIQLVPHSHHIHTRRHVFTAALGSGKKKFVASSALDVRYVIK